MHYQKTPCPICGNATVYSDTAAGGGATDTTGQTVKPGDHVERCDSCGAITIKPKPPAKPKAKKPKAKAKPKQSTSSSATTRKGGK